MSSESTDVRIARVEEKVGAIHSIVLDIKNDLSNLPCSDHERDIEILKTDKRWVYGVSIFIGSITSFVASLFFKNFGK